ncbi:hypothetical protein NDU88_002659 [Pleurodeles waltl]|uniref:Uncharacterized protein n=1 Tax=Pleurodeles waltl TaxID=8319 RepID=A0AAV7T322_PLEWA|nr:hypothetical protein NDU88_002659 [Pleurodeles waltl]
MEWGLHAATREGEVKVPSGSWDKPADSLEKMGVRTVEIRHDRALDDARARRICCTQRTGEQIADAERGVPGAPVRTVRGTEVGP